ncbi:unnamed protein product [Dovyalis caffra]|uniref:F-box associated beta-propeller type 1 domain-containing protein n=1 Tax=Dovyalis caffra TaxID=77055 RepID=A0AAV1SLP9_9ROSI|nr:unnamed protein product [Dovyalis caffra]
MIKDTNAAFLVGSSNGLLCLNIVERGTNLDCCVLWNPATRQKRFLPSHLLEIRYRHSTFGLCFLPQISDYKLLRFVNVPVDDFKAEVFSLSTGSWREVKAIPMLGRHFAIYNKHVIVKGVWYCMASRVKKDPGSQVVHFILTFDMGNDSFSRLEDGVPGFGNPMV